MKAILEFNLPEDKSDFQMCQQASAMYCILHELLNVKIRNQLKHGEKHLDLDPGYNDIRDWLIEELRDIPLEF